MSVSEKIAAIQTNRDQLREKSITMALSTGDSAINDQSKLADITVAITRIPVQKSESGGAISKGVKPGQSERKHRLRNHGCSGSRENIQIAKQNRHAKRISANRYATGR